MRTSRVRLMGIVVGVTIAASAAALAYEPVGFSAATTHTTLSQKNITAIRTLRKLADQHADNCKWNYDQCVQGCAGATSCTNQCQTNYNGCMQN
jgi:hypothetical protein